MSLVVSFAIVVVAITAMLLLDKASRAERGRLRTTLLRIVVPGLHPELRGLRLAFLTDPHAPLMYVPHEVLLEALAQWRPSVLLLGGDFAAGRGRLQAATDLLELLARRWPTVSVCGNTDLSYEWNLEQVAETLRARGGALLRNEAWSVRQGSATVEVLGLDEPINGATDLAATLARSDPGADLRIGLAHSPALWQDIARLGAHITLCGHTHGGQVRLPGLEAPVTHWDYPRRMAAGLFRLWADPGPCFDRLLDHWVLLQAPGPFTARADRGALMYVSRGLGVGRPGLRLLCPPELVCIEFVADPQEPKEPTGER